MNTVQKGRSARQSNQPRYVQRLVFFALIVGILGVLDVNNEFMILTFILETRWTHYLLLVLILLVAAWFCAHIWVTSSRRPPLS